MRTVLLELTADQDSPLTHISSLLAVMKDLLILSQGPCMASMGMCVYFWYNMYDNYSCYVYISDIIYIFVPVHNQVLDL